MDGQPTDDDPIWRKTRHATFLRGGDGKTYILPDEVLYKYEVTGGDHLAHADALIENGSEPDDGFKFTAPRIFAVGHVDVPPGNLMAMVAGQPVEGPEDEPEEDSPRT